VELELEWACTLKIHVFDRDVIFQLEPSSNLPTNLQILRWHRIPKLVQIPCVKICKEVII